MRVATPPSSRPRSSGSSDTLVAVPVTATEVLAAAVRSGWLVDVRLAVFGYALQLANAVPLTTCTDSLAPAAKVTPVQCNVSLPTAPVIEQFAGPDSMLQSTPEPAGSGSSMTTPEARPLPLLDAVTVNPIC